jgi:hypothetical protein
VRRRELVLQERHLNFLGTCRQLQREELLARIQEIEANPSACRDHPGRAMHLAVELV